MTEGQTEIGYKVVELLNEEPLGSGAYGAVYKARCDELLCAAKVIHPILMEEPPAYGRRQKHPIGKFERECQFMMELRHPNIVQYLGLHQHLESNLPILLMELLDYNLTYFLEKSQQPLAFHLQVNLSHDISLALTYLHAKGIVHRDLSGNNVMLLGDIKAKIADFGMAKLCEQLNSSLFSLTQCPGAEVYMPPEALENVYTETLDCFSFGVIIVQILTRQFPKPSNRTKTITVGDESYVVRVLETERRQNHISKIDSKHPLLSIALDCLQDCNSERPSAIELCKIIETLKSSDKYILSARKQTRDIHGEEGSHDVQLSKLHEQLECERRHHTQQVEAIEQRIHYMQQHHEQQVHDYQELLRTQRIEVQRNEAIIREAQHVNDQLRNELEGVRDQVRIKEGIMDEKQRQLCDLNQQIQTQEQLMQELQRRISELERNN